jgi:dihydrofolate reductase
MPRLAVFNNVTLDGCFAGEGGDLRWAHAGNHDPEYQAFVAGNAKADGALVFGRVTYQMMAGWWPTPAAAQMDPVLAGRMNALPKIVFSRTLPKADWAKTTLVRGDAAEEMRRRKAAEGPDMVILGSGRLVAALAREGLIDEYQLLVNPVVLGKGRTMFEGVERPLSLALTESRAFPNGKVFLRYAAEAAGS